MKRFFSLLLALMICLGAASAEAGLLPAFAYQGDDPCLGAACDYIVRTFGGSYESCDVTIPSGVALALDDSDPEDTLLWGVFSLDNYAALNTTLFCMNGGTYEGLVHLKAVDGGWQATSMECAGDQGDYSEDVERIFGMREGLLDRYQAAGDDAVQAARMQFVSDYVRENGLSFTQRQDFGWPPEPLIGAPETAEADQIVHYASAMGYGIDYDLRLFSFMRYDDQLESFSGVGALEGISLSVELMQDGADAVAQRLAAELAQPVTEETTIGEAGLAATCVRDATMPEGVNRPAYVLPLEEGCLVVSLSNTYYAGEDSPVVDGADAALEALLAAFRLG